MQFLRKKSHSLQSVLTVTDVAQRDIYMFLDSGLKHVSQQHQKQNHMTTLCQMMLDKVFCLSPDGKAKVQQLKDSDGLGESLVRFSMCSIESAP